MSKTFKFGSLIVPSKGRSKNLEGAGIVTGSVVTSVGVPSMGGGETINNITNVYNTTDNFKGRITISDLLSLSRGQIGNNDMYLVYSSGSDATGWSKDSYFELNDINYPDETFVQWMITRWEALEDQEQDLSKHALFDPLPKKVGMPVYTYNQTSYNNLADSAPNGLPLVTLGEYALSKEGVYVQDMTERNGKKTNLRTVYVPFAHIEGTGYVGGMLNADDYKRLVEGGIDGFSPIAKVSSVSDGAKITITDKNGTTEVVVLNGKDGTSVTILGSYNTAAELIAAHPTGKDGDAYIVGDDLYVWSATFWKNVGPIRGPKGDKGDDAIPLIDTAFPSSSADASDGRTPSTKIVLETFENFGSLIAGIYTNYATQASVTAVDNKFKNYYNSAYIDANYYNKNALDFAFRNVMTTSASNADGDAFKNIASTLTAWNTSYVFEDGGHIAYCSAAGNWYKANIGDLWSKWIKNKCDNTYLSYTKISQQVLLRDVTVPFNVSPFGITAKDAPGTLLGFYKGDGSTDYPYVTFGLCGFNSNKEFIATDTNGGTQKVAFAKDLESYVKQTDLPTNHVTTDTAQTITAVKTFNSECVVLDNTSASGLGSYIVFKLKNVLSGYLGMQKDKPLVFDSSNRGAMLVHTEMGNTNNAVGGQTTPVYVDATGSVQPCDLSTAYTANKWIEFYDSSTGSFMLKDNSSSISGTPIVSNKSDSVAGISTVYAEVKISAANISEKASWTVTTLRTRYHYQSYIESVSLSDNVYTVIVMFRLPSGRLISTHDDSLIRLNIVG